MRGIARLLASAICIVGQHLVICFVYIRQLLFDAGKGIASKMVMFLPRNVDINQLAELCLSATPPWSLEVLLHLLLFIISMHFLDELISSRVKFVFPAFSGGKELLKWQIEGRDGLLFSALHLHPTFYPPH